jgi:aryl-alcohol dehydrogenase-like predicted oxidoreductase
MKSRKLGKSDISVSPMGMGCWALGGPFLNDDRVLAYGQVDDKESIKAVHRGLDLGVTLFDTANVYGCGRSERVLGKALKGRREDVIIATKFAATFALDSGNPQIPCRITGQDVSQAGIKDACRASLDRLQTDRIDLYQLHAGDLEPEKAPEIMDTLEELVDDGLIRYYGWSTDHPDRAAVFAEGKHCASVQFRHNLLSHNQTMIVDVIDKFGLAGLIKGPLGYGMYTGKYKADSVVPKDHMWHGTKFNEGRYAQARELLDDMREILTMKGHTLAQAALGWIWAQHDSLIPIPGFKSVKQVEENAGAMERGPLNKKQLEEIDKLRSESGLFEK